MRSTDDSRDSGHFQSTYGDGTATPPPSSPTRSTAPHRTTFTVYSTAARPNHRQSMGNGPSSEYLGLKTKRFSVDSSPNARGGVRSGARVRSVGLGGFVGGVTKERGVSRQEDRDEVVNRQSGGVDDSEDRSHYMVGTNESWVYSDRRHRKLSSSDLPSKRDTLDSVAEVASGPTYKGSHTSALRTPFRDLRSQSRANRDEMSDVTRFERKEQMVPTENTTRESRGLDSTVNSLLKRCNFLEAESQYLREREVELQEELCRVRSQNSAMSAELKRTHDVYREALAARRNAREALSEMAQQNARLVSAFVEKKQEMRCLQDTMNEERQRWAARLQRLESDLQAAKEAQAIRERSESSNLFSDSDTDTLKGMSFAGSSDNDDDFTECMRDLCSEKGSRKSRSPGPKAGMDENSSRMLKEIQLENMRLQEENEKLRKHYEEVEQEKKTMDIRRRAEELKQNGNNFFKVQKYEEAVEQYSQALKLDVADGHMKAVLYCNRAAAQIHLCRFLEAISDCYIASNLDAGYMRVYQRRADALIALGDYPSALQDLQLLMSKGTSRSYEVRIQYHEVERKSRMGYTMDPYKVLGVEGTASGTEIRAAYRTLALKYHPDKANGQPGTDVLFKMIAEANSVLSDEEKRREVDTSLLLRKGRRSFHNGRF